MPLYVHAEYKKIILPGGIQVNVYKPLTESDTYFGKNVTVPTSIPLVGGAQLNVWQCTQLAVIFKYITGIKGETIDKHMPPFLKGYLHNNQGVQPSGSQKSEDPFASVIIAKTNGEDGAYYAGQFHLQTHTMLSAGQSLGVTFESGKPIDSVGIQFDLNTLLSFASIVAMKQIENSIVHGISKQVGWDEQADKRKQEYVRAGIKSVFLAMSIYAKGGLQPFFTWQKAESEIQPNTGESQQSIVPIAPPMPQQALTYVPVAPPLQPNKSLSTDTTKKGRDTQTSQQDTPSTSSQRQQLLNQIQNGRTPLRHIDDEEKKKDPEKSDMQQSLEDGLQRMRRANSDDPQVPGFGGDDSEWD